MSKRGCDKCIGPNQGFVFNLTPRLAIKRGNCQMFDYQEVQQKN